MFSFPDYLQIIRLIAINSVIQVQPVFVPLLFKIFGVT